MSNILLIIVVALCMGMLMGYFDTPLWVALWVGIGWGIVGSLMRTR